MKRNLTKEIEKILIKHNKEYAKRKKEEKKEKEILKQKDEMVEYLDLALKQKIKELKHRILK